MAAAAAGREVRVILTRQRVVVPIEDHPASLRPLRTPARQRHTRARGGQRSAVSPRC